MNIVSLSEDEQGWQNEQAKKKKNGESEPTSSPPIDSVLVHIQLLLSHVALSQCEHTLVQQDVFQCMFVRAKC